MASNHLEDLVAEWYEFTGYLVRRNVQVGRRGRGGYECELDVVAFHPLKNHLVQIEASLDSDTWAVREQRYARKFAAGREYIPKLFPGLPLPDEIDHVALFVYGSKVSHPTLAGGRIQLIAEFMDEIRQNLRLRRVSTSAVPEHFSLLRSLQFAANYWK